MSTEPGAGPVIGQIETDRFCDGCGYNLHSQTVFRDERLGIPVTRCPECGRFSASGYATSAARLWVGRLGTILLTAWVFFLILLFALFALFLGIAAYGHMESKTAVVSSQVPVPGSGLSSYKYSYHYVVATPAPPGSEEESQANQREVVVACFAVMLGLMSGGSFAVFLWHCKGWRSIFCLLPSLAGCGVASLVWAADSTTWAVRGWGVRQIMLYCVLELLAAGAGLWLGRPIARAAVRILVPPKPRQHLAFLWTTDGKKLEI